MARKLRLESKGGVYHVINRGNYRSDIFRSEKTKAAFLKCLEEVCGKTGWRVHAWCLMSNHYHLAIDTPKANLVEGMRWLQGTFSTRFNRLRKVQGHLFQGRYKSLIVEPGEGLGPLCHYIHLNPVRAKLCTISQLAQWTWSSVGWLSEPKRRARWFNAETAFVDAGGLADTIVGRKKYLDYLKWLSEDEPAQKALNFESMSKGWAIGSKEFKKDLVEAHEKAASALKRGDPEEINDAIFRDRLAWALRQVGKTHRDLFRENKTAPWKLAVAAALKESTTVTNRWLGENLNLGALHEVSRKVSQWNRHRDLKIARKLMLKHKPQSLTP